MIWHDEYVLDEIEECKYEYPNKVNKVPVQTDLFNHAIVATTLIRSQQYIVENNEVDHYSWEHVKSVETSNKEED